MEFSDKPYVLKKINGEEQIVFTDPRPDVGEDVENFLWADFLCSIYRINKEAALILHGFRCQGTRLVKGEGGGYVIRPHIGKDGWESQEDYNRAKVKYLEPIRREILLALKKLR